MKKILKKINLLAIGAMIVGGGFAFATVSDDPETQNTYFDPETESWMDLPEDAVLGEDYLCTSSADACTGYRSNPSQSPINVKEGTFEDLAIN